MVRSRLAGLAAGALLALGVTQAQANTYEVQFRLSGLTPSFLQEVDWSLVGGTLPRAVYGQPYAFNLVDQVTPSGVDGIAWSATGLPDWLSLNANSGELTGQPSVADVGSSEFPVVAKRLGSEEQVLFSITVGGVTMQVSQVEAGGTFSCAITGGGAVKCWGSNNFGQLGDGTGVDSLQPVTVTGLGSGVKDLSVNHSHACVVTTSGAARCWGNNQYGNLGDGTTTNRLAPVTVSGMGSGVAKISAGGSQTCAVTTGGAARCWGNNHAGRLGDGTTTNRTTPVAVSGLSSGVRDIVAGGTHACAVLTSGAARCWGWNEHGQLGDGSTTNRSRPVAVSGLSSGVLDIAPGSRMTCARKSPGGVLCWGRNDYGQVGDGTTYTRLTPRSIITSGVAELVTGGSFSCARLISDEMKCWGYNTYGQLGDGATTNRTRPVTVQGLDAGISQITAKSGHACAVTGEGKGQCWGRNQDGQLGNGTVVDSLTPDYITAGQ